MKVEHRFLVIWLVLVTGCTPFEGSGMANQETEEAVRLKAVLLEADNLAGSAIDITIDEGEILLEGFVETTAQRRQAEELVRKNSKLDKVSNQIVVK